MNKKQVVVHKISIEPFYTSDYEIISHHFDTYENKREVDAFMQRFIFKPYELGKNVIGVELNFNKEFYVPEKLDSVEGILDELTTLDREMNKIEI